MLITFKSKASGDVIMFGDVAKKILYLIGKGADETKGIITVEQLPEAISHLKSAIDADKTQQAAQPDEPEQQGDQSENTGIGAPVSLAQRAWPLLEALEYAHRDGVPVIWEAS